MAWHATFHAAPTGLLRLLEPDVDNNDYDPYPLPVAVGLLRSPAPTALQRADGRAAAMAHAVSTTRIARPNSPRLASWPPGSLPFLPSHSLRRVWSGTTRHSLSPDSRRARPQINPESRGTGYGVRGMDGEK